MNHLIVENNGYITLEKVKELIQKSIPFAIYKTHKNTNILVESNFLSEETITLYQPKKDRLPWKLLEGKKIISGSKIFDSNSKLEDLNQSNWNNKNQIMSYKEYSI